MAKVAEKWSPVTFVPKLKQYAEAGIDWRLANKDMVKIMPYGYKCPSKEEEDRLLDYIAKNPMCGIAKLGEHEMHSEARDVVKENIKLKQESEQQQAELEDLRAQLAALKAAKA